MKKNSQAKKLIVLYPRASEVLALQIMGLCSFAGFPQIFGEGSLGD